MEEYGFAWQAGLRQGSRLVEICKVAAVTLTHEQMIDLLRTSVTVKVVIIPPYEEGGPRRSVCVCVGGCVCGHVCVRFECLCVNMNVFVSKHHPASKDVLQREKIHNIQQHQQS